MTSTVLGVILAGGLSHRFNNRDKFLLCYQGKPLIHHVIDRALPQVHELMISANDDLSRFNGMGIPVIGDTIGDHGGPLAGIITAMRRAVKTRPTIQWVASFPADAVTFPAHWVEESQSYATREGVPAVYAKSSDSEHFIYAVWSTTLLPQLEHEFARGRRSLKNSLDKVGAQSLTFQQPFDNINTPEQWRAIQNT